MMNGTSTHFVLCAGSGGSSGSGYSRGRNDHQSNDDDNGSSGYNRSRNDYQSDDRGSGGGGGGYSRGRNDYQSSNDDRGSGGYNRGRNDYHNDNSGGYGGDDTRMETQRDTIFIQNLPRDVTNDQLRDTFSQIGVIKVKFHSYHNSLYML